ncbi:cobaltochelatase subunit CobN [Vibrio mangrovi]|uniref:Cobaltochelatase subunit CobN n=1 Tax=Vibrio mangrovi TaxID=474394 RepID=A0A1Y6IXD8_9VIBR|nr:cobaltochelatase subunit CobN [Vibrio mangrovi]MDW6002922.1 cobaltochelatase subunit CobN [Vibrio mangrovi]SMS01162.1 Aerobic cobaltochelatase subunit CobN [Vibrio mangrovi]
MRFIILFMALVYCSFSWAGNTSQQILMLVSQRNAETIAEAGAHLHQQYPRIKLVARTENQWIALSAQQRAQYLSHADVLIGIGLYGAIVGELNQDLKLSSPDNIFIFNSDHHLVKQSRLQRNLQFQDDKTLTTLTAMRPDGSLHLWLTNILTRYPQQTSWLTARSYWQAGGVDNTVALLTWAASVKDPSISSLPPRKQPRLRWWMQGQYFEQIPSSLPAKPVVMLLDHLGADRPSDSQLFQHLCQVITRQKTLQCIVALAAWGDASVEAVAQLQSLPVPLSSIVMLQDFVIGGGEGREKTTQLLTKLNVPLLKAIKLRDRTKTQWQLSADGIRPDKVYYQVAMPEIQGASQPMIVATAGIIRTDSLSGIQIQPIQPEEHGIETLARRIHRWHTLQIKSNADKRIAIVYYNHPPGRHNIGADNLDVPASLWQILNRLKASGYQVGDLPESQEALLDLIQERAVNLPNDRQALATMSSQIPTIAPEDYRHYFETLPPVIQNEMINGPFGRLQEQLKTAIQHNLSQQAQRLLDNTMAEMVHLVEGVNHPSRKRALSLLTQLKSCYQSTIEHSPKPCWEHAQKIITALQQTGIEGLGGWGELPGNVMVYNDKILLPSLTFGHILISPQPPRGWEVNPELLHANLAFPPPHQYLAYYHYLKDTFKADAIIHVGRHSTYEFLPHRSVGLGDDDYSRLIAADIPGIYPYIVDGVGEGIQAKRRGLAVMVDHLTPPLESTPLYDDLLQLRQLVESFESNHDNNNQSLKHKLISQIRHKVESLDLKEELTESMSAELAVMGIGFEEVSDDMLVHEIGHYLTNLQERFMPYGLHIFGKTWQPDAIDMMVHSMSPVDQQQRGHWHQLLQQSPAHEMTALLNGLNGRFIEPGKGNDPIRSPESLPTGRNFYALDNSLIPSRIAWQLGQEMARDARKNNPHQPSRREALVLWASDIVRDEGVMIAFALDMLGLEPVWNSRGLVKGLKYQTVTPDTPRRDMVFTTSGLFRDLYGQQMHLLDQAVLMALDAASETIIREHPALTETLQFALKPLGSHRHGGNESLQQNQVAAHWVEDSRKLLSQGNQPQKTALLSTLRVFGDAPGSYGAGVNRLAERSGAWQQRAELADVYLRRLGHGFSQQEYGIAAEETFRTLLHSVENTYFGRSSNLYGLIDNNDAFDYLGGLSLAVETLSGHAPNNYVINHANPEKIVAQPLGTALRQELRGRFLNPEWLSGLMKHGYAGARTMGNEFLEYLWGWQVTNPTLVGDWAWQEVKEVYFDDRYQLGVDQFLEQGHNVHVKSNMLAIMLVAIHKGFWHPDPETTKDLAHQFAQLVIKHGLPGSGHTVPDHPMMPWIKQYLSPAEQKQFEQLLQRSQMPRTEKPEIHSLTEVTVKSSAETQVNQTPSSQSEATSQQSPPIILGFYLMILLLAIVLIGLGFRRSRQTVRHMKGANQ